MSSKQPPTKVKPSAPTLLDFAQPAPPVVTEKNLQRAISDLHTINALLPSIPHAPKTTLLTLLRTSAIVYTPYIILTHFIPMRVLLGIVGTVVLTWRAPWAHTTRRIAWNSAHIRWATYHLLSRLTGQALSTPDAPAKLQLQAQAAGGTKTKSGDSVRFLFTIYENQRWWMGLDWTSALLPAERQPWCSSALLPVSPPSTFTLPEPTVSYLPVTDGKGKKHERVKRTAQWSWAEGEWMLIVKKDANGGSSRVERPLPAVNKEDGVVLKAIKSREASTSSGGVHKDSTEQPYDGDEDEIVTDADGWIYGDNKWEGTSAKGGMGKYTRYRRWTRVAVLSETIEVVEGDELGVAGASVKPEVKSTPTLQMPAAPTLTSQDDAQAQAAPPDSPTRSALRQRLMAAAGGNLSSSGFGAGGVAL
ncbi:hypothetical protein HWV62_22896 [Athelia sp. TMB]|nr:hypothetical protein HWV62_22896 [Athelia sp. TMB]